MECLCKKNNIKIQIRLSSKKEKTFLEKHNQIIPSLLLCFSTYLYWSSLEENRKFNLLKRTDKFYGNFNLLLSSLITSLLFNFIIRKQIHFIFLFINFIIFWSLDLLYRKLIFIQSYLPTIIYIKRTIFITIFIEISIFSYNTIKKKKYI